MQKVILIVQMLLFSITFLCLVSLTNFLKTQILVYLVQVVGVVKKQHSQQVT